MRIQWLSVLLPLSLSLGCGGNSSVSQPTSVAGSASTSTIGAGRSAPTPMASAGNGTTTSAAKANVGTSGSNAAAPGTPGASPTANGNAGANGTSPSAGSTAAGSGTSAPAAGASPSASASGGATASTAGAPAAPSGSGGGFCGPAAMTADADGPWKPMHVEKTGPTGASWIFYPEGLGKDGMKHPIFDWGPGAGTGPSNYTDHLNRLASHGFVVISQASTNSGKAALDWILAENEKSGSMWHQKLDTTRVGRGGHSMGALQTFSEAKDPRLSLYVLVCGGCMSGSGGCGAADIHAPTVILGGDTDIGTPNFEGDYDEIKSPVAFLTKDGTDHIACARNNLAPWVAFMRMTWCSGEKDKYMPDFSNGGTYCKTPWKCMTKGF